jgi:hypothetical protein
LREPETVWGEFVHIGSLPKTDAFCQTRALHLSLASSLVLTNVRPQDVIEKDSFPLRVGMNAPRRRRWTTPAARQLEPPDPRRAGLPNVWVYHPGSRVPLFLGRRRGIHTTRLRAGAPKTLSPGIPVVLKPRVGLLVLASALPLRPPRCVPVTGPQITITRRASEPKKTANALPRTRVRVRHHPRRNKTSKLPGTRYRLRLKAWVSR